MKIVEYNGWGNIVVEFQDEHKYRKNTTYSNFKTGCIKNPYDKTVYGIAWIGEGKYLAKENGKSLNQNDYIILDYFLEKPTDLENSIFKKDWEEIQEYIKTGRADKLSCSMGKYIEPKTKGANNQDTTDAPDGKGGVIKARRRAFYYKKNYTNSSILPNLDLSIIK